MLSCIEHETSFITTGPCVISDLKSYLLLDLFKLMVSGPIGVRGPQALARQPAVGVGIVRLDLGPAPTPPQRALGETALEMPNSLTTECSVLWILVQVSAGMAKNLTLNAPMATKVVCSSRLLKCLRSLYGKQCGPRSDCSYRSSLFWVHAVCFYTLFVSNIRKLFAADDFSRRHFQVHFFLAL